MARPRTAFVFPGLNGAGHTGEHMPLLESACVRDHWRVCQHAFAGRPSFAEFDAALHRGDELPHAPAAWPYRALAVTALQLGTAQELERRGEHADWLCGYSVGDLARSCHAGALSFAALVAFAAALPELPLAAGASAAVVAPSAAVLDDLVSVLVRTPVAASRLSRQFLMLAGAEGDVAAALATCRRWPVRTQALAGCPLHAPQQRCLATLLFALAGSAAVQSPRRAMFSTLWGRAVAPGDDLRAEFAANVCAPIDFAAAVASLHERHGVTRFLDLGPGRHAARFVRHHGAAIESHSAAALLTGLAPAGGRHCA
ncbi:MAG: hypothetical protein JNK15_10335 [Planctomycetes bacterium]|nr:hypothetical protein [Planctomycetota bacterium]